MANKDLIFTVLGIDRASRTFDKVGDSMDKMANRSVKALAGITGASAASATAVAAAVAGMPVLFTGLAAVALRENEAIRDSFSALSEEVQTGLAEDAAPLRDEFVGAARDIAAGYNELRPQMREAFEASQPAVEHLTESVLGFTRNAMPGMVEAVKASEPVMAGLESLSKDTGAAVSDMFEIWAESSEEAGQGITHVGDLIEGTLPEAATILADLTGLWAEHGDEAVDVINRIMGVLSDLSGGALPLVGSTLGVTLDVLSAVLNVIEPMSDELGHLIGLWLSLGAALKAMRAVQGIMLGAATSVSSFAEANKKAASAKGVGGFRAALGGVTGLLGGPFGIAIGAGIAALALFGDESNDAAGMQRSLSQALRQSNGAFDEQARLAILDSEAYQEVADKVDQAGISHGRMIDALIEGDPALGQLRTRLEQIVAEGTRHEAMGNTTRVTYTQQAEAARDLLGSLGGLRGGVTGATEDFRRQRDVVNSAKGAMERAVPGAEALDEAIKTLGQDTASTADHVDALNTAWRRLFGISITFDEAKAKFNEGLASIRKHVKGVKKDTDNWRGALIRADGSINLATEAGRTLLDNLVAQGDSYRELAQTAHDTALQQGQTQREATQAARRAVNARRRQFLREARQLGFTKEQARRLANEYLGMPKNVRTLIRQPGMAVARAQTQSLAAELASIPRHITVGIRYDAQGNPHVGSSGVMRAHGGRTRVGQPTLVGEEGDPELFVPDVPGRILSPSQSATALRDLMRGGDGAAVRDARPAVVHNYFSFPNYVGTRDELIREIRREVNDEGGDVQKVLGR